MLNLSVFGFTFVGFHDKTKRTHQGNLLTFVMLSFEHWIVDRTHYLTEVHAGLDIDCKYEIRHDGYKD